MNPVVGEWAGVRQPLLQQDDGRPICPMLDAANPVSLLKARTQPLTMGAHREETHSLCTGLWSTQGVMPGEIWKAPKER